MTRSRLARSLAVLTALAGACALGSLGGCAKDVRSERLALAAPQGGKALLIDIETFRGDVTVRVEKGRKEASVSSDVSGSSDLPDADKAEVDRAVKVSSVVEERAGGPTLVVRATSERVSEDHRADIMVFVPATEGVRVKTGAGEVILVGVRGALMVENGDGAIEIRTNEPLTGASAISTNSGDVYYQAPLDSTGVFDVRSEEGEAIWRAGSPEALATPLVYSKNGYSVTLNQGTNAVTIRTGKGMASVILLEDAQSRVRTIR